VGGVLRLLARVAGVREEREREREKRDYSAVWGEKNVQPQMVRKGLGTAVTENKGRKG
jgi:hypothetical protein